MVNRPLRKRQKGRKRKRLWRGTPIRQAEPAIVPRPPLTVTAHDMEIMGVPRVVAIYWGSAFTDGGGGKNQLAVSLDNFFRTLLPSRYMGLLSEYGIGPATFVGSVWLPVDQPGTMDDAAVQAQLCG